MKLNLGRTKDIKDGFALLTSGRINKKEYIQFATALKPYLDDYESIIGYSEMITK